jgi:exodeoxyribonuclease V beta subunit
MTAPTTPLDLVHCPLEGRRLIEASAGTGKTYTICLLYLRALIERRLKVRDVLVVSFTKAATAELKERIRARLVETLAHLKAPDATPIDQGLADLLEHYKTQQRSTEEMQTQLAAALSAFDEAGIHTIHGFCKRVFDDAPFVTGMPLAVELIPDDADYRAQIVADLYREWLHKTCPPASVAVRLWEEKTLRDLDIELKRWLAKPCAKPCWPLAAAVPNTATHAQRGARYDALRQLWMRERAEVVAALTASLPALDGRSYSLEKIAVAASQWDAFLSPSSCEWARRPMSPKDCKLKLLTQSRIVKPTAKKSKSPVVIHPFYALAEIVHQDLLAREQEVDDGRWSLVKYVVEEGPQRMAAMKREARTLSYDDLLKLLFDRLSTEAGAALRTEIRTRFPVALVDEFQDTDPLQYGIFDAVYADGGTLLLVGDPKQAIYAFRNADLHVYFKARESALETWTLTHNQRSSGAYLEALNAIFGVNPRAFLLAGLDYHDLKEGLKPKKPFADPHGDVAALQLWCLPGAEGDEVLSKTPARQAVATATAAEISRLLRGARAGDVTYDGRPLAAGDVAVIVPTHKRGTEVRSALAALGIGAVVLSRDSVYSTDEAQDLARILDAVLAPNRAGLVRAALATILIGYRATELRALNDDDERLMAEFERFERYRSLWAERGIGALLRSVMVDYAVTERLLTSAQGERRLTNLRQLIELCQAAAAEHPAPDALRRWLHAEMEDESADEISQLRLESDRDLVQIVSIHASKGLEYPIVFCPSLWDDFLGGGGRRRGLAVEYHDEDHQLVIDYRTYDKDHPVKGLIAREVDGERLRLIYVALSRAIHRAYLVVGPWHSNNSLKAASGTCLQWLATDGAKLPYAEFEARGQDAAAIRATWARLLERSREIRLASLPQGPGIPVPPPQVDGETLTASVLTAPLPRARRSGSYSSLLHGASHEAAVKDRDARVPTPESEREKASIPADDIRRFPRGARAGECIHAVFEAADFTDPSGWPAAIAQALASHPPGGADDDPVTQTAMLTSMLAHVLATPLDEGLTLNAIGLHDRLVEWEFSLPAGKLEANAVSLLLAEYGYRMPALRFATLEGYLRGFVDLIVRSRGRYYVIDWKSNVLGDTADDYVPSALDAAMTANGYHLQHLLYTVALHRWLRRRLPGYDYDMHLGGTRYLFIRAVRPDWPQAGIYADRPPRALIEGLSALLDPPGSRP